MAENDEIIKKKNRRRMAWISLISMNIIIVLCLFVVDAEELRAADSIITTYLFIMGSIVGTYIGFSTVFDYKNRALESKTTRKPSYYDEMELEEPETTSTISVKEKRVTRKNRILEED